MHAHGKAQKRPEHILSLHFKLILVHIAYTTPQTKQNNRNHPKPITKPGKSWGRGRGNLISRVTTLLDSNVQCSTHETYKETGKYDPFKEKKIQWKLFLKKT